MSFLLGTGATSLCASLRGEDISLLGRRGQMDLFQVKVATASEKLQVAPCILLAFISFCVNKSDWSKYNTHVFILGITSVHVFVGTFVVSQKTCLTMESSNR